MVMVSLATVRTDLTDNWQSNVLVSQHEWTLGTTKQGTQEPEETRSFSTSPKSSFQKSTQCRGDH